MNNAFIITGGRIVDPVSGRDEPGELYIENGLLADKAPPASADPRRINAKGLTIVPGLTDIHVHFREPGNEAAETVLSGSRAAARGGFTRVVTMPNTTPPVDSPEMVGRLLASAGKNSLLELLPAACITRGRAGRELADIAALARAGARAFTDDGSTVDDPSLLKQAMIEARKCSLPVLDHALGSRLAGNGVMRAGDKSKKAGLPGIPVEAETETVARDIDLASQTGCRVHIQHVSTSGSVYLIRQARKLSSAVSAEVTPHHIALTVDDIDTNDALFKVNPPIGTRADREAIIRAVADGTIEALATDHAPHTPADKAAGFKSSSFGVIGLETAVGVTYTLLVKTGIMTVMEWLKRWTIGPCRILGIQPPSMKAGNPADLALLNLSDEWTVDPMLFLSKARNTPFTGMKLTGRADATFFRGKTTWSAA